MTITEKVEQEYFDHIVNTTGGIYGSLLTLYTKAILLSLKSGIPAQVNIPIERSKL